jgi:opine dehydrogenase
MTAGVARVMSQLDAERRQVAMAFGHSLLGLINEMQAIGTVHSDWKDATDLSGAIAAGEANQKIKAPDSFSHRYYLEDFGHGLLPFLEFAEVVGVQTPVAKSLYELARVVTGTDFSARGRTARRMGFQPRNPDSLMKLVRS